ncbi:MFS transporter [Halalkalibacterium halodurans]|nr:MFS transporter [Halalkalibacterium halodurans]MED4082830.1 MFS transporter [Halalkalibacterium halodurans]MED4083251.1 MFS transporter [Halalkalibacterium halodurans]MED4105220.1 MFS transporter [Halalkalibacterium halodurans]MED4110637.1 MFS transporter [Halalkalibacterium halodurans]MED4125913.1 MFS transporter [Halalkalibacterium halodurans]
MMTKFIYIILVVAFIDTFIQLPIITPYALSLGASETLVGGIVAIYSLANMVGNIIGGHWVDRFGRKRMLYMGMLAVGGVLLLYPLAQTGGQLFFARLLHGLAGGVLIPAAFALIGDQAKARQSRKPMAFAGASIGIAAITGPAIGGILAAQSRTEYVFILVAILFFLSVGLTIKFVPESMKATSRQRVSWGHVGPLLKNVSLMQACLAAFALMVSNGTLAFALPLLVTQLGLTSAATGMLLSIYGITALFIFITPLNKVYERLYPGRLVVLGLGLIGVSLMLLSFIHTLSLAVVLMVTYGIGFAFVFPSMNQMVSTASQDEDRGKAYGIFYAVFSLGVVAGSFISGVVTELLGVPFIVSGCLMLGCSVLLVWLSQKRITESYAVKRGA